MSEKKYSLGQNSLFNMAGTLVYYACQWLITLAAARLSTDENVGLLQLAMTVSNIFISVANYNMRVYQVSDVRGEYRAGHYVATRLLTCGAAAAACLVYSLLWGYTGSSMLCVMLYMVYRLNESLSDVLHGVDQNHDRMDHVAVSYILRGILMLGSFLLLIRLTGSAAWAMAGMAVLTLAVVGLYDVPRAARYDDIRPAFEWPRVGRLLRACLPGAAAAVLFSAIVSLPRQQLARIAGEVTLGYYATVATPLVFVQTLVNSLINPALGQLSRAAEGRDWRQFFRINGRLALIILITGAGALGAIALLGEPVMTLIYGEKYRPWVGLMYGVTGCVVLYAADCVFFDLLVVFRRMTTLLVISGLACGASVALAPALIGAGDPNGVSYSVMIAYALFALLACAVTAREIRRAGGKPRTEEREGA